MAVSKSQVKPVAHFSTSTQGPGRVAARQEIPVPPQHRVRLDQQPEPAEHVPGELVQQGGQEHPVDEGRTAAGSYPAAAPAP